MNLATRTSLVTLALAAGIAANATASPVAPAHAIEASTRTIDRASNQPAPYLPINTCKNGAECAETNHSPTALRIAR